jgi:hypothetical protein
MAYKPRLSQFKQGHCDGRTSQTALCRVVVRVKRNATQGEELFLDQFSTVYAISEDITIVHGMNRWLDPQWPSGCVSESMPIVSNLCLSTFTQASPPILKEPVLSGARAQRKEPE